MGRKASFDRQEKLMVAMQLFWRKGYANTAISDLVDEMQINRFSLYHSFGDKQQLYYEALNAYLTKISMPKLDLLTKSDAGWDELLAFLEGFVSIQKKDAYGCFMQNALVEHAGKDDQVLQAGGQLFDHLTLLFTKALSKAQQCKKVTDTATPDALAILIVNHMQGMRVLAKAKRLKDLEMAFETLLILLKGRAS
ncbi:TetR/AcrR family transcriptional regulator [Vibrio sonorensis]|uniref:TetR/AcrR family transcriptional regulator n=1 Tax=Vibrio sonorensis TaxID=1004316 RepID=UPI0008DA9F06|nr:TetR/AcrR family transcriptional regulator [Vibrio sonorensis]